MARQPFICGNWKLHHDIDATKAQVKLLVDGRASLPDGVEIAVAPVTTCLAAAVEAARGRIPIAAQNVHFAEKGAFTGEVSTAHLKELGVTYVIVGHSERRAMFGDTDETVAKKTRAVLDARMKPIACVGETLAERDGGKTHDVVGRQTEAILAACKDGEAAQLVLAYEPVWAIGTGRNATPAQAQDVHAHIRSLLRKRFGADADAVRIQYGGSVKPDNAKELLGQTDVDGALVGGASLEAASLLAIAKGAGL